MSTRRAFLLQSTRVAGGLLLLDFVGCAGGTEPARIAVELAALLPADAARIGRLWLDEEPADGAALSRILFPKGPPSAATPPEQVRRALAEQVAAEHRAGQAKTVQGWRLAPTELSLCAIAALG